MGYIRHDAIVVTSWNDEAIEAAAAKALDLRLDALGPSGPTTNGYRSMLVCPDGSNEGWPESEAGESRRMVFIEWLNSQRYEDGSTPLSWVALSYGSDDEGAEIRGHAWMSPPRPPEDV
jgi:hypothetical protein